MDSEASDEVTGMNNDSKGREPFFVDHVIRSKIRVKTPLLCSICAQ
jgi:hypothetical protein